MPVTVTNTNLAGTSSHEIDFKGVAGVIFIVTALAVVLNVVGFATTSWSVLAVNSGPNKGDTLHSGLWQQCFCYPHPEQEPWFKAVKAMVNISLILMLVSLLILLIYICIHIINKNIVIVLFIIGTFGAAVFMLIGVAVHGSKSGSWGSLSWSFAFACASCGLCVLAAILGLVQLKRASIV